MKTGFLTLLMVLAMVFTGCQAQTYKVVPSKNYVTQRVNLGNVSSLTTYSFVDIIYKPSSGPAYAEVYAPDNIAKYVKLEEKGGELKVIFKVPGTNSYSINGKYTCEVRVYAPSVTSFCTLSSGDIKIDGDSVIVQRQYEDRYHELKAKMPCLVTALSELNEPRYMTPGGIFDAFDKEVTVWGRADLKDVDDSNLGLKGSPTKIAKASDKVRKGAGEKVALDTDEAVSYLIGKFKEKHII